MKVPGLVVALLVLPLVTAAHAQEEIKESKSVKLADVVGSWVGTWPNADVYAAGSTTPTRGLTDTITIRSDSTWRTRGKCYEGTVSTTPCAVIGDTLSLGIMPKVGRAGYVVTLKDQQITITSITDKTTYFIGKRIDVPKSKP